MEKNDIQILKITNLYYIVFVSVHMIFHKLSLTS